jgi:gamma-glutamyltranspeptidase
MSPLIETKKAVYRDVYGHNADPNAVPVPLEMLTSKPHAASLCSHVNPMRASATGTREQIEKEKQARQV